MDDAQAGILKLILISIFLGIVNCRRIPNGTLSDGVTVKLKLIKISQIDNVLVAPETNQRRNAITDKPHISHAKAGSELSRKDGNDVISPQGVAQVAIPPVHGAAVHKANDKMGKHGKFSECLSGIRKRLKLIAVICRTMQCDYILKGFIAYLQANKATNNCYRYWLSHNQHKATHVCDTDECVTFIAEFEKHPREKVPNKKRILLPQRSLTDSD